VYRLNIRVSASDKEQRPHSRCDSKEADSPRSGVIGGDLLRLRPGGNRVTIEGFRIRFDFLASRSAVLTSIPVTCVYICPFRVAAEPSTTVFWSLEGSLVNFNSREEQQVSNYTVNAPDWPPLSSEGYKNRSLSTHPPSSPLFQPHIPSSHRRTPQS
jgi:hypothetical protein